MKLRLTDYSDNTYMDTDGSCDLCMYTGLLDAILWRASYQTSEEELNKALSWALVDKTA